MFEPNIGNSVFPEFNDNRGLMLCGYEWGFSKSDQDWHKLMSRNEVALLMYSPTRPLNTEKLQMAGNMIKESSIGLSFSVIS